MSRLLLYKRDASPPSCAVRMLAQILDIKFDVKDVDLFSFEHKQPEFKKMNPMGTVPVLKDGDFVISESHAIMKYLLGKYGGEHREKLYPSDVTASALVDQAMYFEAGVMFIRLKSVALPTLLHGLTGPTPKHVEDIDDAYDTLEAYLKRSQFTAADHLTLADLSLGSTVGILQTIHKLDGSRFPRSVDWLSRLAAEPYYKDITAPGAALFGKMMNIFWENNKNRK